MSYFPWEDNDREGFKNRYKNLEEYIDKDHEEHKAEDKAGHKGKQQHVNVKGVKKHMHGKNKEGQHSGKNKDKVYDDYNQIGGQRHQTEYQRGFIDGYEYAHNSGFKHVYGHSICDGHDNSSSSIFEDHGQYSMAKYGYDSRDSEHSYHGFGYDSKDSEHSYHGFGYDSEHSYHGFGYDSEHSCHGFGYDISDSEHSCHGFGYDISDSEHSCHGFGYDISDSEHGFEFDYDRSK